MHELMLIVAVFHFSPPKALSLRLQKKQQWVYNAASWAYRM